MNEESAPRDPETILADFLHSYNGDYATLDYYRPSAQIAIGWLKDEGWVITRLAR